MIFIKQWEVGGEMESAVGCGMSVGRGKKAVANGMEFLSYATLIYTTPGKSTAKSRETAQTQQHNNTISSYLGFANLTST
ncbi:hypothetical protein TWF506_000533 [Arthrobotrys conoides]|uniref:Uncharacterized protein n=1 Tax=Arthrobotrys conoides TaxID=74498 RepID=A0AAN8NLP5_9PEZI